MGKALVSILMPVYLPDFDHLHEAVKSIVDQEYRDWELVIVEDPGPAPGQAVVEGFKDPRIRYHLNEKRTSLREQLNLGIGLCRGEFIARMDDDDISLPSRIRKQVSFLEDNPEISLVGTNLEFMSNDGRALGSRRYPEHHDRIARDLRLYSSIAHATIMIRKPVMLEMEGYKDAAPMEDWDLWCRMCLAGKKFYNIQEVLYRYRHHPGMGKYKTLRKTLLTGIQLKERYFKNNKETWGMRESFRCLIERVFMYMPARLVFGLFFIYSTFFENRKRAAGKAKQSA